MQFRSLSLHNFGLLAGDQTLDLRTNSAGKGGTPIILVGGQNGAGKTTILEALRLCLYGRLAFEAPIAAADYQSYLASKIHRPKGDGPVPDTASILLEFELATQGQLDVYKVQRSWRRHSEETDRVSENILIFKNDALLDDVEADYWQDFIQGLIPSSLSQLFFFDGEQIQRLANEETDTRALGAAVKALLGLEVVERLQSDLSIYSSKELKRANRQGEAEQLQLAEDEFDRLEKDLLRYKQDRAQLANEIGRAQREIELVERDLMQAGRGLFDDRESLQKKRVDLDASAAAIEHQFQALCESEFPFVLCADLCRDLQRQLKLEQELSQWQSSRDHVKSFADQLVARARQEGSDGKALESIVEAALEEAGTAPPELQDVRIFHGLSVHAQSEIERWLAQALDRIPGEVKALNRRLEKIQRDLSKTQQALDQVPDQDALRPLMERLFKHQQDLAILMSEDGKLEQTIAEHSKLVAQAERTIGKAENRIKEMESNERRLAYATKVQEALKVFQARLTDNKLRQLEAVFVETFNYLSRKLNLSRASIHDQDFVVDLHDEDGRILPKSQLSAGEKQIYAIAMLWSLAKISGRNLPFVIDTPLGRLDSVHRSYLVERYFPEAAHQVIILSTDTEIDQEYFRQLQPRISKSYFLRHERGDSITRIEERYFWKEATHA